jgi:hypothetical protein
LLNRGPKFFADGQGEPSLGDVSKFRNGLEAPLQGQFDVFRGNAALLIFEPAKGSTPFRR